jgi:hypothetical protein
MSSSLCKRIEGAIFPFPVEPLENEGRRCQGRIAESVRFRYNLSSTPE